jgi:uncharacterized repeat protein (TIGR01451 family)
VSPSNRSVIGYSITVTSTGPSPAKNAVLTDALPAGTGFQSVTAPSGWSCRTPPKGKAGTVTCRTDSMAPSTSLAWSLVVKLAGKASSGSINNVVSVTSDTADPNTANNQASASTTVGR